MGAALTVALHSLRLPQPEGARLTGGEVLRERAFSYGLAVAGVLTWHAIWCAALLLGGASAPPAQRRCAHL
jgi:hypothetical protein